MPLVPGAHLGPYEVVVAIGHGGMGEVYRAHDTRLGRDVAIKVLPASFAADPERRARFQREARAVAALSDPHVLAVHDVGEHDGHPYLVTELLDGETLRDRLMSAGPLPVRKSVDIAVQVARGLAAAHAKGIVHRDLKPENIFVLGDGQVKILDFGLARPASTASGATETGVAITEPGVVMGTVGYMAPEQVRGQAVDSRADLFALGAVLYEMLSGQRAFKRETAAATMSAILTVDPPELVGLRPEISPSLERIVRHCLEKNPAERFQAAPDVAFALEAISGSSSQPQLPPQTGGRRRLTDSRRALAAGSLAAGLVIGGLVVAMWGHRADVPDLGTVQRLSIVLPEADNWRIPNRSAVSLSPDGQFFVFAGSTGSETSLWLRRLDSDQFAEIPGSTSAADPFWSPDGRQIGFFGSEGKLRRVSVNGEAPVALASAPDPRGGSWSSQGVIIFAPTPSGGLMSVSENGGDVKAITQLDTARGETSHRFPTFLPDGRHFLFVVLPAHEGKYEIDLASTDEPGRRPVLTAESGVTYTARGYLLYARQGLVVAQRFDPTVGKIVGEALPIGDPAEVIQNPGVTEAGHPIMSASRTGLLAYPRYPFVTTELGWMDLEGHLTAPVPGPPGQVRVAALSHDDSRAVLIRRTPDGQNDLWMIDLRTGSLTRFAYGASGYGGLQGLVLWSPHDDRVAYAVSEGGSPEIVTQSSTAPGGATTLLLKDGAFNEPLAWSPDGQTIVYARNSQNSGWKIWLLPVSGDHTPRRYVTSSAEMQAASVSPDGRWLSYATNETGRWRLYVDSFPTPGNRRDIGDGLASAWVRGGTLLVWSSLTSDSLMGADVQPGPQFQIGAARLLVGPAALARVISFQLTNDARRLLASLSVPSKERKSITVVTNWTASLAGK